MSHKDPIQVLPPSFGICYNRMDGWFFSEMQINSRALLIHFIILVVKGIDNISIIAIYRLNAKLPVKKVLIPLS